MMAESKTLQLVVLRGRRSLLVAKWTGSSPRQSKFRSRSVDRPRSMRDRANRRSRRITFKVAGDASLSPEVTRHLEAGV